MPLFITRYISAHSLYGLLICKYQLDLAKTHFQFSIESDWFIVSAEEVKIKRNTEKNHRLSGEKHFISLQMFDLHSISDMNILTPTHIRTSSFSITHAMTCVG